MPLFIFELVLNHRLLCREGNSMIPRRPKYSIYLSKICWSETLSGWKDISPSKETKEDEKEVGKNVCLPPAITTAEYPCAEVCWVWRSFVVYQDVSELLFCVFVVLEILLEFYSELEGKNFILLVLWNLNPQLSVNMFPFTVREATSRKIFSLFFFCNEYVLITAKKFHLVFQVLYK